MKGRRRDILRAKGAERVKKERNAMETWAVKVAREASLRRPRLRRVTVAVGQGSPEDRAIRAALLAADCRVEENWRPGIPAFFGHRGGAILTARDERGAELDSGQLLAALVLVEMENGGGKVAVPAGATAAVDLVAAGYGAQVLRLGRDGEAARERYTALPWLWFAPSAAVRLCERMGVSGQKLEGLIAKTPRFNACRREVPLESTAGAVLRSLAEENPRAVQGRGLRLHTGRGWVYLKPGREGERLQVLAEGPDLELAAELCDLCAERVRRLDRKLIALQVQKQSEN